jgi:iron complex transport system substrate-binding protein
MGRSRSTFIALALITALALTACGGGDADPTAGPTAAAGATTSTGPTATGATFPVTVDGTNGSVTIEERPERIVSLSPTATEDLFAIGAGDQVIAVDDRSNFPPDAPVTELSGFEPNVEAIAGYRPDLVVFATEPGDLGSALEGIGITALQLDAAATLEEAFAQIETLGLATGHGAEAAALAERLGAEVQAIVAQTDGSGLTYYYELDDTFYSVTSETFIGQLFASLGLENIADAAAEGSGGYPQLSAEYIIEADPDLIFLADTECCGQSPETVASRPGWDRIGAVNDGGVIPLDDDVASRWGPRVVELLRTAAEAIATVEAEAA